MAGLAGWYFRRAARQPGPGEAAYVDYTWKASITTAW